MRIITCSVRQYARAEGEKVFWKQRGRESECCMQPRLTIPFFRSSERGFPHDNAARLLLPARLRKGGPERRMIIKQAGGARVRPGTFSIFSRRT